jgi:hypothetical protein
MPYDQKGFHKMSSNQTPSGLEYLKTGLRPVCLNIECLGIDKIDKGYGVLQL